jgi:hypothetical protein
MSTGWSSWRGPATRGARGSRVVSIHLRGRIGAYRVLVPAASVLDVWAEQTASSEAPAWRGRRVPYVDGRVLLGEPAPGRAKALLAYGATADDPKLVILGIDEVLGSVQVSPEMLKPFPPSLADAHRLFDAIATLPGEPTSLLRFRTGLDLAAHAEIRVRPPATA